MIRLQKYLAMCGVASRRKSEEMIQGGQVTVNGRIVRELGTSVDPYKDYVKVAGKLVRMESVKVYLLMNKPSGVVTTSDDQFDRKTVIDLLEGKVGERVYPVGRLDYDTEGLILLTNDGEMANKIMHPSSHLKKKYQVVVRGGVTKESHEKLQAGVDIGDYVTAGADIKLIGYREGKTELEVTISEGKNRQIRRMFEAVGHEVIYLKRVSIGPLRDESLKRGEWRHLTDREVRQLTEELEKKRNRKPFIVNELLAPYEEKAEANGAGSRGKGKGGRSTGGSKDARKDTRKGKPGKGAKAFKSVKVSAAAVDKSNSAAKGFKTEAALKKSAERKAEKTLKSVVKSAPVDTAEGAKPARGSKGPKKREKINLESEAYTTKRVNKPKPFAFKDSSQKKKGFR